MDDTAQHFPTPWCYMHCKVLETSGGQWACECVGEMQYKKKTKIKEDVGRGWKDEMKEAEINTTKFGPLKVRCKREKGKT